MTHSKQLPRPCLIKLIAKLTEPSELRKLLGVGGDSLNPGYTYQPPHVVVNGLAYHFSSEGLAQGSTAAEKAQMLFTDIARTSAERKDHLLSTKTRHNVPLLYYAVASQSTALVNFLLDHGASKQLHPPQLPASYKSPELAAEYVPVLAISVALKDHEMVHLLLKRGADPLGIPADMYLPDMQTAGYHAMVQPDPVAAENTAAWCRTEEDEQVLRDGMNMMMQYWLARALKLPPLTGRCMSVTHATNIERIPELRMAVIGQGMACSLLYNNLLLHFGVPDGASSSRQPLVLLLAGPPGHGKTLAGEMMQKIIPSAAFHIEDCARLHHVGDLWGFAGSFQNSEVRPTFAAFMSANSGKPSVVVLDEFEKMSKTVQNSMLKVFHDGDFIDIYKQERYNCSKTIFLLTSNAADPEILKYWSKHQRELLNISMKPSGLQQKLKPLVANIKAALAGQTSRSLTSRLTGVIPFFPFTPFEQSMVVHKTLLNLKKDLAEPPNEKLKRLHGNIKLELRDQQEVCRDLAKDYYDEKEGARAVINAINSEVSAGIKTGWIEEQFSNGDSVVLSKAVEDPDQVYDLQYIRSNSSNRSDSNGVPQPDDWTPILGAEAQLNKLVLSCLQSRDAITHGSG